MDHEYRLLLQLITKNLILMQALIQPMRVLFLQPINAYFNCSDFFLAYQGSGECTSASAHLVFPLLLCVSAILLVSLASGTQRSRKKYVRDYNEAAMAQLLEDWEVS
ncbi:hypothetical protein NDU88_001899 [Pleurodeles waltl]|uniref:Uncharacterized protein n=1 Tax=Pleurodeles waltl TaxID=8319 RepID=A0AAV7UU23_PLEWA|nr:hypothetical protein NDU88_001899 [Pleurodeles waltl]